MESVTITSASGMTAASIVGNSIEQTDYLLIDADGNYIIDVLGYYINLGGGIPSANGITSGSYSGGSLTSGSIPIGNDVSDVTFTPGS